MERPQETVIGSTAKVYVAGYDSEEVYNLRASNLNILRIDTETDVTFTRCFVTNGRDNGDRMISFPRSRVLRVVSQ